MSRRSETGHSLNGFRVPGPLHCNLRGGALNLTEIVRRKLNCDRSDVLFEAMQLGRAWDRNNPRLLRQKPCERDLSRCGRLP